MEPSVASAGVDSGSVVGRSGLEVSVLALGLVRAGTVAAGDLGTTAAGVPGGCAAGGSLCAESGVEVEAVGGDAVVLASGLGLLLLVGKVDPLGAVVEAVAGRATSSRVSCWSAVGQIRRVSGWYPESRRVRATGSRLLDRLRVSGVRPRGCGSSASQSWALAGSEVIWICTSPWSLGLC